MIGSLLYLTASRPDISYNVGVWTDLLEGKICNKSSEWTDPIEGETSPEGEKS